MTLPGAKPLQERASAHHRRHRTASTEAEKPLKNRPFTHSRKKRRTPIRTWRSSWTYERKCIGFFEPDLFLQARRMTRILPIAKAFSLILRPKAELYRDTRFQGYEPAVTRTCQAKKSRPEGNPQPLRSKRKRKLARIRVNVEHALAGVKRSRIVKDVLQNTKDGSLGFGHGSGLSFTRSSCSEPQSPPLRR